MKGEQMLRNTNSIITNQNVINVPSAFKTVTNSNNVTGFESAYAGAMSSFGAYGGMGSSAGGTTINYSDQSRELASELEKEINTFYEESMTKYKQFIANLREEWVGDAADIYFSNIEKIMKYYEEEKGQCLNVAKAIKDGIQSLTDTTQDATAAIGNLPGGN